MKTSISSRVERANVHSEKGAIHILGGLFALISIYSTYLLLKEQFRSDVLVDYVEYQKKQIDSLELRMQILELRHGRHEISNRLAPAPASLKP